MGHHHSVPRPPAHDGLSVILAYGNRGGSRPATRQTLGREYGKNWVHCHDGFTVSVVAGPGMYCRPRPDLFDGPFDDGLDGGPQDTPSFYSRAFARVPATYRGPYHEVEVGFPSARPEPWAAWRYFACDPDEWDGLYAYVPAFLVRDLVRRHGGVHRLGRHGLGGEWPQ